MAKQEAVIAKSLYETLHEEIITAHVLMSDEFDAVLADIAEQRAALDVKLGVLKTAELAEQRLNDALNTVADADEYKKSVDKEVADQKKAVADSMAHVKDREAKLAAREQKHAADVIDRTRKVTEREGTVAAREVKVTEREVLAETEAIRLSAVKAQVAKDEQALKDRAKQFAALAG